MTWTASAPPLWVLAQRAIWFRLLPIRANSTARARSTSACATAQVWVRSMARRTRAERLRPARRAFVCHSARSDLHPDGSLRLAHGGSSSGTGVPGGRPDPPGKPLPGGGSPWSLDDDTWGARWRGNTRTLPADLVGRSIRITTRTGETWISTVKDVLHRDAASILVRDSGKG